MLGEDGKPRCIKGDAHFPGMPTPQVMVRSCFLFPQILISVFVTECIQGVFRRDAMDRPAVRGPEAQGAVEQPLRRGWHSYFCDRRPGPRLRHRHRFRAENNVIHSSSLTVHLSPHKRARWRGWGIRRNPSLTSRTKESHISQNLTSFCGTFSASQKCFYHRNQISHHTRSSRERRSAMLSSRLPV